MARSSVTLFYKAYITVVTGVLWVSADWIYYYILMINLPCLVLHSFAKQTIY